MTQAAVRRRLEQLADRYGLTVAGRESIEILLEHLAEERAPTTVHEPSHAVEAHVADALTGLEISRLRSAEKIADLGAGAGIPGLVLAAALPDARVFLVESVAKKTAFIDRAAAAMGLDNAEVVTSRVETWRDGIGGCDAVSARALAALPVLVEYAAPLLRVGGALLAWKGDPEPAEHDDGEHAARVLGMSPASRHRIAPQPGADRRSIYVYEKLRETPDSYPRRPGMARKRPLRAAT